MLSLDSSDAHGCTKHLNGELRMFKFIDSNYLKCCFAASVVLSLAGCGGGGGGATPSESDLQSSMADLRSPGRHCKAPGPLVEPAVPDTLRVPDAATLVARYHAVGTQIYTCLPDPNAPSDAGVRDIWTFKAPSATLYNSHCCVAATHFAGPTWQSVDGSSVVGAKVAAAASPNADSIPILLLSAKSNTGSGIFSNVTYIQRLDTEGGLAPNGPCDTEGAELQVPYEANYYFYMGGV
jgi:hypothetical protein